MQPKKVKTAVVIETVPAEIVYRNRKIVGVIVRLDDGLWSGYQVGFRLDPSKSAQLNTRSDVISKLFLLP